MKTVAALSCVVMLAIAAAASAVPFENASVVGHVQDRIVITVEPGVALAVDKSGGTPLTGLASIDGLTARHAVADISPLYAGIAEKFDDDELRQEMGRWYAVDFVGAVDLDEVLADYGKADGVFEARPVDICRQYGTAFLPNDLNNQYYLRNEALAGGDVRALGGWAETLGDSNVIVAVADSGVDWNHPDLGGPHPDRVNGAIWTNWDEYYGISEVDDDNNGYVDDIRGWDWVHVPGQGYPDEDDETPDNDPSDYESHGTNCAGCVAPLTNNGIGIAGTASGCKIMALRVGYLPDGESGGVVRMDWASQAFFYAAAMGARIFNASWGSSSFLSFGVREFLDNGGLIVTAAGNDSNQDASYLCGYPDGTGSEHRVLAVAATQQDDGKADFSNYGSWIDLAAPGVSIYTTAYSRFTDESTYATVQGTSFASPLTAGAAALIWSSNLNRTAAQVSQVLRFNCDNIDAANPGYEDLLGYGRVNLTKALGDDEQRVPQEFASIQDAMNCAAVGDVVKILADEILPAFTVIERDLQILGGYAADYQTRDPLGTPTMVESLPTTPVLDFYGDVTNTTVVDGFHLTGGGGRTFANIPYSGRYGGGIMLNQKSPTLRNLAVSGNSVGNASTLGLGGGIALYNSDAVLENITVTGNTAIYGGGVFVYQGSPSFSNVTLDANTLITDNLTNAPLGGGIHVIDAFVTLDDVVITGHIDSDKGGGIYAADLDGSTSVYLNGGEVSGNTAKTNGGGICALGGTIDLVDVIVSDNGKTAAATFMGGGGLYADGAIASVAGSTFDQNEAHSGSGAQFNACPEVYLAGTSFTRSTAALFGGTVYVVGCTQADLHHLTIADNSCPSGGAGLYSTNTPLTVANTISAFNTGAGATANGMSITGAATLTCNDVFGNEGAAYGGVSDPTGTDGNVALDPQFCDRGEGDYHVNPNGPCAPAHSGGCNLIGALVADCGSGIGVSDPSVPVAFRVDQSFPNPFNPATTIRFALPAAARTSLVIYDVKGRVIKTLVDTELEAATHTYQWRGRDNQGRATSAGIYFYKITSGDHQAVGRMALIK